MTGIIHVMNFTNNVILTDYCYTNSNADFYNFYSDGTYTNTGYMGYWFINQDKLELTNNQNDQLATFSFPSVSNMSWSYVRILKRMVSSQITAVLITGQI